MAKPGSGLLLDPQQTALTMNQRIMFNRLVAQGTPAAVARQVAIAVAKRALAKADWDEADHPRDGVGRFGSAGGKADVTQASALNDFAADSGEYVHINQAARQYSSGKVELEDAPEGLDAKSYGNELRQKVEAIDSAIDDYPLERDTKLSRGMAVDKDVQVGQVLDPHGFTSMSKSERVAKEFADMAIVGKNQDKAVVRVNGKFGQPILDTTKIIPDAKGKLAEKEYLLDRGYGLKIVADHGTQNGRRILDAVVVRHTKKGEGMRPPPGVQSACKRGLELAPEYGGQGLTDGAKARARSMAAGNSVSPDQVRRMAAFFGRHSVDKKPGWSSPPTPGYVAWMLWGGDAGKRWAASNVEKIDKSEQTTAAMLKNEQKVNTSRREAAARACAQARVQARKADNERPGYHKAFAEAAKAILPVGVTEALHRRARAVAGGHGKAVAAAYAQQQDMDLPVAKAEAKPPDAASARMQRAAECLRLVRGQKPLGAAYARAKATGEKQDEESRKRRANKYLKENGHSPIGKSGPDVADIRQEDWVDAKPKRKRKDDEERESASKSDRVPVTMPTRIVKAEDVGWKKLVWSVVYEPDVEDTHGDYMDAETIEKAAHGAMRNGIYINREHAGSPVGAHVVESYVAPCEMRIGPPGEEVIVTKGSWVMGMQIETEDLWADVLNGTFTGFSLEGSAAVPAAA